MNKLISAAQIAKEYGLSYQTVNYYTNLGFLRVIESQGNKRLYDRKEVEACIENIRELKRRGYPLRLIREELLNKSKR